MAKKQTKTTKYRVRVVYDNEAVFEECNGESRPLTREEYTENEYMNDGKPIPYAEYLSYYGNPDRHVFIGIRVDMLCPCCKNWTTDVADLWNIDLMDDGPELAHIGGTFTAEQALELPGCLAELAREVLDEAGAKGLYPTIK